MIFFILKIFFLFPKLLQYFYLLNIFSSSVKAHFVVVTIVSINMGD